MSTILLALLFALKSLPTSASPLANTTADDGYEPSFKPNPKGRGTLDLLMSSSVTLTLAVWTVIHPNIIENPTVLRSLRNKGLSDLLACLAPEVILVQAMHEYSQAKKLVGEIRRITAREHLELALRRGEKLLMEARLAGFESEVATSCQRQTSKSADSSLREGRRVLDGLVTSDGQTEEGVVKEGNNKDDMAEPVVRCERKVQRDNRKLSQALEGFKVIASYATFWRKGTGHRLLSAWLGVRFWILRHLGEDTETTSIDFTMEDAFFTVMGGYTCTANTYSSSASRPPTRILAKGLVGLFKAGFLTANELAQVKPEVADRSKADSLAKLLVCIQAGWMVINCAARLAAMLPVTLLELNVLTHVILAVFMYVFWWRKPHNVRQSISLSPRFLNEDVCAILYHLANSPPHMRDLELFWDKGNFSRFPSTYQRFIINMEGKETEYAFLTAEGQAGMACLGPFEMNENHMDDLVYHDPEGIPSSTACNKHPGHHRLLDVTNKLLTSTLERDGTCSTTCSSSILTKEDLLLAIRVRRILHKLHQDHRRLLSLGPEGLLSSPPESIHRTAMKPANSMSLRTMILFAILGLLYTLIHTSAWNMKFPTLVERTIWRYCCGTLLLINSSWFFLLLYCAVTEVVTGVAITREPRMIESTRYKIHFPVSK